MNINNNVNQIPEWDWWNVEIPNADAEKAKGNKKCSCKDHEGYPYLPPDNFHQNRDINGNIRLRSECDTCYNKFNNDVKSKRYSKEKTKAWQKQILNEYGGKEFSEFQSIKNPSEKDYNNFIGAYLLYEYDLDMEKEKPINSACRPDQRNYKYKFYIETKLTDKLSRGSRLGESCEDQKDRYVNSLPDDWTVFLVSLDGSVENSLTFPELLEEIKKIIKKD